MLKKIITICLLPLMLMTMGIGCKGLSDEQVRAVRPVTINYWTVYNNVSQLRKFAAEYKARYPHVTVNIRQVRYDEFGELFVNALADDVAPDIISVHNRQVRQYAPRLSTMPAQVQVARMTIEGKYAKEQVVTFETHALPSVNTLKSSFVGAVAEDAIINNEIYGIPLAVDTLALYYNKDLLDRAGIAVPPTTWDEFMEAVIQTTKKDSDGAILQSGVALGTAENIDNATDILALLMLQNGVNVTQPGYVTFAGNISKLRDAHPTLQALRFFTDFSKQTKEVYAWNNTFDTALEAFTNQQSVFYFGFAYDKTRIKARAPQMNVSIVPIPQLRDGNPVNVASYWVESVVDKSKNKDTAWDFIRFISTPNNIKAYTEATNLPSPVRSHLSEQAEDPLMAPFISQILTATNWYYGRDIYTADTALREMIETYRTPYPSDIDQTKRDAELINSAAARIYRTL
jgi:multiple sugar transport system substrate-binding protein